jgi:hypothetical protein
MKKYSNIYTTITMIQLITVLASLSIASLSAVFDVSYLIYFWYLSLAGMAFMMSTSFVLGIAIFLTRISKRYLTSNSSVGVYTLISKPKNCEYNLY